ncbi:MAG: PHP domain-containing protein [Microgenomates group bacterium]
MSYNVDLHTHSTLSPDGGLSISDYSRLLSVRTLDYIAITDHNEITFAQEAHKMLGEAIIVGEEIMTTEGEIIGLFLSEKIEPHLSAREAITQIKQQKGLVYIPHPFETMRSGLSVASLSSLVEYVDIVEVFNGRGLFTNKNREVQELAHQHSLVTTASSDAHCRAGVGNSFATVSDKITKQTLVSQLANAQLHTKYAPVYSLLCPKMNTLKKIFIHE